MRIDLDALQARAKALHLNGLLAHWQEADKGGWVAALLDWEEQERARRGLERRLAEAHIGRKRSFLRTYAVERGDGMKCPP
jgi:hypothetical protein